MASSDNRSWVESANDEAAHFSLANLPFGVFALSPHEVPRVGVAIGDSIVDVCAAVNAGLLSKSLAGTACESPALNTLMQMSRADRLEFRETLTDLLREGSDSARKAQPLRGDFLFPIGQSILYLPVEIGDYTDFYASIQHATNVGKMFRPDNPLLPNYKYVPIGYHGRASSIVVSGTPVRRPLGQTRATDATTPTFGPSRMLDYESELGLFVGKGNDFGSSIVIRDAEDHVFGYCLVNDWSARDIQAWEYQPLGPFLAKNFATTVSPWVVTAEAIEPYRVPASRRPPGDPQPLDYLSSEENDRSGGIDATLEVYLSSQKMRGQGVSPFLLSRAPFSLMYWTMAQLLTHHASNGCNLRTGDLIASGTVSGPTQESLGCLLELTKRGANPVSLPTGETRKFLEDGDEVIMRGYLGADDRPRIGFGECRGAILPAIS
ncbi:MAG: fumarylacetoacetase [Gemmatimonadaceae bacterium]